MSSNFTGSFGERRVCTFEYRSYLLEMYVEKPISKLCTKTSLVMPTTFLADA